MPMRITLNIRDDLIRRAAEISGIRGKDALIDAGLEALIQKFSRQRLAGLGGTQPGLRQPERRRPG